MMQDSTQNDGVKTLDRRKILILYGSETGNSEESAGDIERLARRLHFQTLLEEMNDVELSDLLQYPLVIFVVSTTGQGELPKNARRFWRSLLRKRLPPNYLRQVNFTTFGLGDSSYFQYNWAARKLHKRLEQLGAVECLPRGEADERHEDGIDGTFLPWCLTLRTYLEKVYPLPLGLLPIPPDVQLIPKFTIELVKQDMTTDTKPEEMPDPDVMGAERTSRIKKTFAERRNAYDMNSHGQKLDREAALFSHVDNDPRRLGSLKYEHEVEDRSSREHIIARLSDETAKNWPGGIDILDRPNVLRDVPTNYSIDDSTRSQDESPPASLLPIPGSWHGVVDANIRLTSSSHWQDVRQLSIRICGRVGKDSKSERLMCEPGDVAIIHPKNFTRDVQALIDLMGWGDVADKPFYHVRQSADISYKTPKNCYPVQNSTLRDLLIHNYDITCIPRRTFFTEIAHYTEDTTHRERLREFADPGHSDEFWDYTSRPRRSILEVLGDFESVRIPYQHVPSIFPVIRGREYSIASGGLLLDHDCHPNDTVLDLAVALVKYKTVLRKTRQGLCSRYIASLRPGTAINITFRSNHMPEVILDPCKPLLAIAPGTGIAPIRALFHDRELVAKNHDSKETAEALLFYGGRNRAADFFFEKEWMDLGINVVTAFSRDQASKIYVQDRILEHYEKVCKFLRKGCAICLCGSSGKMPEAVRFALYDCMVKGGMAPNREQAKGLLHKKWVFWEEVW
ncbi:hypothetical protein E0Z10_g5711 [Xylaria hypoxylon]|uniref:NADPH-dependent diflavin oxidoreductase 1 n=1 Tax=Xylaria hypoxylon TaxID=37992 RepID=A0A4Z0YV55_9PEZI|nr:hypothetical protein E0Z10_g5711 [Xylaria hypoxylon]